MGLGCLGGCGGVKRLAGPLLGAAKPWEVFFGKTGIDGGFAPDAVVERESVDAPSKETGTGRGPMGEVLGACGPTVDEVASGGLDPVGWRTLGLFLAILWRGVGLLAAWSGRDEDPVLGLLPVAL